MTESPILPPRANPDLIGHAEAERTLLDALLSGRLPHAWLIGGPAGIGKATLAFRFARFLLSRQDSDGSGGGLFGDRPTDLYLDPAHPTFQRVRAGGHLDLLTVERPWHKSEMEKDEADRRRRVGDLPVDEVRKIAPFLQLTSAEGGWRVVVIDEAERMNRSAANAILKLLEEPPARALILLVSNNPGGLLPTIRSRCRRLTLAPLADGEVDRYLSGRFPDMETEDRRTLTALAGGSLGNALALAEEGGLDLYRRLSGLLADLPKLDPREVQKLGDQVASPAAERGYRTLTDLIQWWLSRLVRQLATGEEAAGTTDADRDLMLRLARAERGLDRWLEVWEKTRHLVAKADSANLDRKQVVLQIFLSFEAAARA